MIRRTFVKLTIGSAAMASLAGASSQKPDVKPASDGADDTGARFHRFQLGEAEVTVLSDGPMPFGDPFAAFSNIDRGQMVADLEAAGEPLDWVLQQNAIHVRLGGRNVLFDTGMGTSKAYGPTTGRLSRSMDLAGIDRAEIDAIVLSHGHIDHCGGIITEDGKQNFPNATIHIDRREYDFWTSPPPEGTQFTGHHEQAKANLTANGERLAFFEEGQEVLPGIIAMAAPGHSIAHTMFMIGTGKHRLCYMADLAHHHVLMLKRPELKLKSDTDSDQAVQSRWQMLDLLASEQPVVAGFHFPWPGIGTIAPEVDGYRFQLL